ncbi:MAG: hypothetical protein ACFFB2_16095 [Promethearchaeota archaeon]
MAVVIVQGLISSTKRHSEDVDSSNKVYQYENIQRILEAGDFMNHAIFTSKELKRGINRLLESGYI